MGGFEACGWKSVCLLVLACVCLYVSMWAVDVCGGALYSKCMCCVQRRIHVEVCVSYSQALCRS